MICESGHNYTTKALDTSRVVVPVARLNILFIVISSIAL